MAASPKYKKLFSLFRSNVETGVNLEDQVYNLPLVLRKDGCEFRLGQAVRQLPKPLSHGRQLSSPNSCPQKLTASSISCEKKQSTNCQDSPQYPSQCQDVSIITCQGQLSASTNSCHTASQQVYLIKEILLSSDLCTVTLVLYPIEVSKDGEVGRLLGELVVSELGSVSLDPGRLIAEAVARDGMRKVIAGISSYPESVQRCVRKHQLAAKLRGSVQLFLTGSSLSRSVSLGDVDWRLDPGILGLDREADYSLEYRIEQFSGQDNVSCHLDLLLGRGWDVRGMGGGEPSGEHSQGYRVILTLELAVDLKQQLRLDTHAITCRGDLSPLLDTCSYRHACVTKAGPLHLTCPDIMESMHSARGVSLDWEEFQEDSFKLQSCATNFTEEDIELSPGSVEEVIREIEGCSFPDPPQELFEGREIVIEEEGDTQSHHGEERSETLKKLLTTPTKGFSQLVFNASVPQSELKQLEDIHLEDEDLLPDLTPIKFYHQDQKIFESLDLTLSHVPESRQTTSTLRKSKKIVCKNSPEPEVNDNSCDRRTEDSADESESVPETLGDKIQAIINSAERQTQSETNNVISSINVEDEENNPEDLMRTQSVSSKVEAYVQSLPGFSAQRDNIVLEDSCKEKEASGSRFRHDNTVLDESFESEASSRSKLSSRQSDLLSTNMRYNNSGMFYGSALGGQTVCPFPSDWQFQTIPETIDNNAEID